MFWEIDVFDEKKAIKKAIKQAAKENSMINPNADRVLILTASLNGRQDQVLWDDIERRIVDVLEEAVEASMDDQGDDDD